MSDTRPPAELNDVDRRIWEEELNPFIPERIFDVHAHHYRWEFNTDPAKETGSFASFVGDGFPLTDRAHCDAWDALLLPGRRVSRLSFGFPFSPSCDFEASNRFVLDQVPDAQSGALMLVHPSMTPTYLEEQIQTHGFLGFKPYRFYARSGDAVECSITDFLPEKQIEVANRHGLIVMLHLGKRLAIADPANIEDLERLTDRYADVKWILAHCARSYAPWVMESRLPRLRALQNVWYDVSSVCDADVIELLLAGVGPEKVMYGSDNLPVGAARGKYITFGYAWAFLSEKNQTLDLSHCNPKMTFVLYEQLRAVRRAAFRLALGRAQIEDFFYNTAARLVAMARNGRPY
jgi:glutamate-1-semialdehyde 2,1-aminomutase